MFVPIINIKERIYKISFQEFGHSPMFGHPPLFIYLQAKRGTGITKKNVGPVSNQRNTTVNGYDFRVTQHIYTDLFDVFCHGWAGCKGPEDSVSA
jgi:hypothetical protein